MGKMTLEFEVKTLTDKGIKWLSRQEIFPSWKKAWQQAQSLKMASNVRNIKFKSFDRLKKVV